MKDSVELLNTQEFLSLSTNSISTLLEKSTTKPQKKTISTRNKILIIAAIAIISGYALFSSPESSQNTSVHKGFFSNLGDKFSGVKDKFNSYAWNNSKRFYIYVVVVKQCTEDDKICKTLRSKSHRKSAFDRGDIVELHKGDVDGTAKPFQTKAWGWGTYIYFKLYGDLDKTRTYTVCHHPKGEEQNEKCKALEFAPNQMVKGTGKNTYWGHHWTVEVALDKDEKWVDATVRGADEDQAPSARLL